MNHTIPKPWPKAFDNYTETIDSNRKSLVSSYRNIQLVRCIILKKIRNKLEQLN